MTAGAPAAERTGQRLIFVDALRGVAASWVLVCHFYHEVLRAHGSQLLPSPLHEIALNGNLGVQIFFVLSGFVIAHSVGEERVTPGFVGRFALRRSLRLDPPYWCAIFAYYLSRRLLHGPLTGPDFFVNEWQNVLVNMFYLDNVIGARSIVAVGWTLCLEVQLYLGYVLLLGLMQALARTKLGGVARFAVFAPLAIYSLMLTTGLAGFDRQKVFFLPYWYMFFMGASVSWALSNQVKWRWTYAYLAIAGLSLLVDPQLQTMVALATALAIAQVGRAGHLGVLLRWRWIQYLGLISYSLYLFHPLAGSRVVRIILKRIDHPPSALTSFALFALGLVIALLVAHLMHRFVERPSQALSKRVQLKNRAPVNSGADSPAQVPAS